MACAHVSHVSGCSAIEDTSYNHRPVFDSFRSVQADAISHDPHGPSASADPSTASGEVGSSLFGPGWSANVGRMRQPMEAPAAMLHLRDSAGLGGATSVVAQPSLRACARQCVGETPMPFPRASSFGGIVSRPFVARLAILGDPRQFHSGAGEPDSLVPTASPHNTETMRQPRQPLAV